MFIRKWYYNTLAQLLIAYLHFNLNLFLLQPSERRWYWWCVLLLAFFVNFDHFLIIIPLESLILIYKEKIMNIYLKTIQTYFLITSNCLVSTMCTHVTARKYRMRFKNHWVITRTAEICLRAREETASVCDFLATNHVPITKFAFMWNLWA